MSNKRDDPETSYFPIMNEFIHKIEMYIHIYMHILKGTDYLPGCYHNMLKDERRFPVLAEVQGEIVSNNMH